MSDVLESSTDVAGGAGSLIDPAGEGEMIAGGRLRRLVPTERQAVGNLRPSPRESAAPVVEPAAKPSGRERAAGFARDLDPRSVPGSKLPLYVLMLSALVGGWGDQVVSIATPEIQASFGLSVAGLLTVQSFFSTTSLIIGLPLGYLVDRVKRVWLVRIAAIGDAVGNLLMAASGGVAQLVGANALSTASTAAGSPAGIPLLTDYFPSRARARVVSLITIAGLIGGLVGTGVAGYLIDQFGWRSALFTLGLFALPVAGLSFLLREPKRGAVDRAELGISETFDEPPPPSFAEAMRGAFAIRTVRFIAIAGMVSAVAGTPVLTVIQLTLANKFLLSPGQRSLLGVVTSLMSIPALILGSALADRIIVRRPRTIMVIFAGVQIVSIGLLLVQATAPNLALFIIPQMISQVLLSTVAPGNFTVMSLVVPARYRGLGLQVMTPFTLVGTLLIPVVSRYAASGNPQGVFFLFMPFMALGALLYLGCAGTVARDIRAARAAAAAQQEVDRSSLTSMNKILVCRDVDVTYDDIQVLYGVDLDVREGEVLALVGTNGAGKSTLLRAICGLQQASNGAIFFDGRDITTTPTDESARRGLVYMPGGQGVFPGLTVEANLQTAASMAGQPSDRNSLAPVLDLFPVLCERLNVRAGQLSGGEQQMVALGMALLAQPRLLMIDELSLGLAPAVVEQLLNVIRQMQAEGTTVILVEQSLNVALTVAERAVFMDRGQIQFDGPTEDLLGRPDLVRAVFMGGGSGGAFTRSRRHTRPDDTEPGTDILSLHGISLSFGGMRALSDVELAIAPGEVVGIIGPNGAGKTTMFDVISGFLTPDEGTIELAGDVITGLAPEARARRGLGRAFQSARLFPALTVRETIAVALERRAAKSATLAAVWAPPVRRAERKLQDRVEGYVELLGLTRYADKFIRELSTGTRRAVEVACQMAAEPRLLLLDEPSSGLAQAETEALGPTLLRIAQETGCGLLVIEHDLSLITAISDRLVAMELGTVLTTGRPEAVIADPRVLSSYLAASNDVIERSGSRVGSVLSAVADPNTTKGI